MIGKASNIGSPEEYRRVFNQAERLRSDGKNSGGCNGLRKSVEVSP